MEGTWRYKNKSAYTIVWKKKSKFANEEEQRMMKTLSFLLLFFLEDSPTIWPCGKKTRPSGNRGPAGESSWYKCGRRASQASLHAAAERPGCVWWSRHSEYHGTYLSFGVTRRTVEPKSFYVLTLRHWRDCGGQKRCGGLLILGACIASTGLW